MAMRITNSEFERHHLLGFESGDPDQKTKLFGCDVELWDNGMGVHLIRVTNQVENRYYVRGL